MGRNRANATHARDTAMGQTEAMRHLQALATKFNEFQEATVRHQCALYRENELLKQRIKQLEEAMQTPASAAVDHGHQPVPPRHPEAVLDTRVAILDTAPPAQVQQQQAPALVFNGHELTQRDIQQLEAIVPRDMLVTSNGLHLFEQFNSPASRHQRAEYRGAYFILQNERLHIEFNGNGRFKTFWCRFIEKANLLCISDGEKLDLLRAGIAGPLQKLMDGYDFSSRGLFNATLDLFESHYHLDERQLKAMENIMRLDPVTEDFKDLDIFFPILHNAATEYAETCGVSIRTMIDILNKFPLEISRSFLLKHPTALSDMSLPDMVNQLRLHVRGFLDIRRWELTLYKINAANRQCPFCKEKGHRPCNCERLTGTPSQWLIVQERGLCYICLEFDHNMSRCSNPKCRECGGPHHTAFHDHREPALKSTTDAQTQYDGDDFGDDNDSYNADRSEDYDEDASRNTAHVDSTHACRRFQRRKSTPLRLSLELFRPFVPDSSPGFTSSPIEVIKIPIVHPRNPTEQILIDAFLDPSQPKSLLSGELVNNYQLPTRGRAIRTFVNGGGIVGVEVKIANIVIPSLGQFECDATSLAEVTVQMWKMTKLDRKFLRKRDIQLDFDPNHQHLVRCDILLGADILGLIRFKDSQPLQLPSGRSVRQYRFGTSVSGISHIKNALLQDLHQEKYHDMYVALRYGTKTFLDGFGNEILQKQEPIRVYDAILHPENYLPFYDDNMDVSDETYTEEEFDASRHLSDVTDNNSF